MTYFIHAEVTRRESNDGTNRLKRRTPTPIPRSPVLNGEAQIRIDYKDAKRRHEMRLRLEPGTATQTVTFDPLRSTPYSIRFSNEISVAVTFRPHSKQHVDADGPETWAREVVQEALRTGVLNANCGTQTEHEFKQFLELWFLAIGTPIHDVFLDDLALVLADLAAVNLLRESFRRRGVHELVDEARHSLAVEKWGHIIRDKEPVSILPEDVQEALRNAHVKVMQEVWPSVRIDRSRTCDENRRLRIAAFNDAFERRFSEDVALRAEGQRCGGPIANPLALDHKFQQSAWTYLKTLIWRRFLDETKLDHIRCLRCGRVWEHATLNDLEGHARDGYYPATLHSGQREWAVQRLWSGSKQIKSCPYCPVGPRGNPIETDHWRVLRRNSLIELINEIHMQCIHSLNSDEPCAADRSQIPKLAERVLRRGGPQLKAALSRLPPQPKLTPKILRNDPTLVLNVVVPQGNGSPHTVSVRVGEACASYLELHGRKKLRETILAFLEEFKS